MVGYTFSGDDTSKNTDLACYRWEWESVFVFFFSDLQAFKKILFSIRLELIYHAVLVSGVYIKVIQLHINMYQFFFKFCSHLGYWILNSE